MGTSRVLRAKLLVVQKEMRTIDRIVEFQKGWQARLRVKQHQLQLEILMESKLLCKQTWYAQWDGHHSIFLSTCTREQQNKHTDPGLHPSARRLIGNTDHFTLQQIGSIEIRLNAASGWIRAGRGDNCASDLLAFCKARGLRVDCVDLNKLGGGTRHRRQIAAEFRLVY